MNQGACLCGAIRYEAEGPFKWLSHCHCSMCRKHHGAFYGSFVAADAKRFRFTQDERDVVHYRVSAEFERPFCPQCGSKVPEIGGERVGIPAGTLDGDFEVRQRMHIFVAHQSPMETITDDLRQFDDYPPGYGAAVSPPASVQPSPTNLRGGCLCGAVEFSIAQAPTKIVQCHCSRCRHSRGTPHGVNTFVPEESLKFTRGAEHVKIFRLPNARSYSTAFCDSCGSLLPYLIAPLKRYLVPVGSLDTPFEVRAVNNIYVGSKAPWFTITNTYPQFEELPPRERIAEVLFD